MTTTQEELTHNLGQCEQALLKDPTLLSARQYLWQAYWGLADLYYNRGDFDGHIGLLKSVIDVSDRVAKQTGLDEYPARFISWEGTCGLGHLAQGCDMHVKARNMGMRQNRQTIILAEPAVVANRHYLKYWEPYFDKVINKTQAVNFFAPLGGARGYFGILEDHFVVTQLNDGDQAYCEAAWNIQEHWDAQHRPFLLQLTNEDRARGYDTLFKLGMPKYQWFATLHVRESNNWDHAAGRNVSISDYFPAIAEIVERGGWVIRMGNPGMTPLPPMPNVIDYAHSEARNDWMDVFLFGGAKFALCTQSGPAEVPPTFGVPTILTNWQFGFRPGHKTDTAIFKRYKVNDRVLPLEQSLTQRYAFIESPHMFTPGVQVIPNSPEEIREVVQEFLDCDPPTEAEQGRQAQLDAMQRRVMADHKHRPNGYCRVGRKWLERVMHDEANND